MRASPTVLGAGVLLCLAVVVPWACGGKIVGDRDSDAGRTEGADASSRAMGGSLGGDANDEWTIVSPGAPPPAATASSPVPPPCAVPGACRGDCAFPITAADCAGCTFPCGDVPSCANSPEIRIVYPPDGVLLPPNLNVFSVQWTPHGSPFQRFSVDFTSPPNTDWHVLTSCAAPTTDEQSGTPSGGCELTIDPVSWSKLVGANRGGDPVTITVRGTTDGLCASTSANSVRISFAEQDLIGTYYYWKSTVSPNGVGGQIWRKTFGDLNAPEQDVTSSVIPSATCNGCHALSRDGSRMVVYSDDNDSDDEYSDVGGSLLDMTTSPPTELANGVTGPRQGGQPPGLFDAFGPLAAHYVSSNGLPLADAGATGASTSAGYPSPVPVNGFSLWNGQSGAFVGGVAVGASGVRPTMPDWSADGTSLVYVQPAAVASWDPDAGDLVFSPRSDDDHIFGGSLYTVPYATGGVFGSASVLVQSGGENNYYPSYSPEKSASLIIFNRAPLDTTVGALTGCAGMAPQVACPNDSFSNPAARLMVVAADGRAPPIDLERANSSPSAAPVPMSNSYPRWAPFVQSYKGQTLLWFTFSSTRDYGLRVLNHKPGMYQCYPPDSYELPGAPHGQSFAAECKQPQLWMSAVNLNEAHAGGDPSRVAFWVPYQDLSTHNHTAQWTQQMPPSTPPSGGCTCSMLYGACGAANPCGCCAGEGLACDGNMQCIVPGAN
jgi:hypothetical protein